MTKSAEPELPAQADYELLAQFRLALRRFSAFSAAAAQAAGLPPQQHQALLAIKGSPDEQAMTIGMMAEQLFVAPHTATELAGRLARAGLVTQTADPDDRRRQTLALTAEAEAMLARLSAVHLAEIREMAPRLIATLQSLGASAPRKP